MDNEFPLIVCFLFSLAFGGVLSERRDILVSRGIAIKWKRRDTRHVGRGKRRMFTYVPWWRARTECTRDNSRRTFILYVVAAVAALTSGTVGGRRGGARARIFSTRACALQKVAPLRKISFELARVSSLLKRVII